MGRKLKDYSNLVHVGDKFGKLTVLELPEKLWSHARVSCRCDCGKEIQAWLNNLLCGFTTSCGCWRKETIKTAIRSRVDNSIFHGDRTVRSEYWKTTSFFIAMHQRVNGKYKSRGITICEDWAYTDTGYNNFKAWLLSELDRLDITLEEFNQLPKYNGLSVDRMNNDLGYCSSNCRLATPKQQQRNRSNSKLYEGHHILDWADALSIPYDLIEHIYPDTHQLEVLIWLYSGCPSEWNGPVFPSSRVV